MMRCEVCLHKIVEDSVAGTKKKIKLDLEHPVYCPVTDRFGQTWLVRTTLSVAEHKCNGAKK